MKTIINTKSVLALLCSLTLAMTCTAAPLPTPLTAALMLRISELEKNISSGQSITIVVINNQSLAKLLENKKGTVIGNKSYIKDVIHLNNIKNLENYNANIIYVGRTEQMDTILDYAKTQQAITISSDINSIEQGIVLSLYDNEGIPGILLNLTASKSNSLNWNPDILNIVAISQ